VRSFIFFFIVFTLAEIFFSTCYYLLVEKIDAILILGAVLYIGCMITAYMACRVTQYHQKRKALLDSFL
jgi:hypothetical protein